jgi:hypothetical protein
MADVVSVAVMGIWGGSSRWVFLAPNVASGGPGVSMSGTDAMNRVSAAVY